MSSVDTLSVPVRISCAITHYDPALIAQCSNPDHNRVVRHAMALLCGIVMQTLLWSPTLALLLPTWSAVAAAMFIGLMIYLLDLSIATSDWELKGVLAQRHSFTEILRRAYSKISKLIMRLIVVSLALVTGSGFAIWLFDADIRDYLQNQRQIQNAPILEEYRVADAQLATRLLGVVQDDLLSRRSEHENLQTRLDRAQSALEKAAEDATAARLEAHRQKAGLYGRKPGSGNLYTDALLRLESAERLMARAQEDVERARVQLEATDQQINELAALKLDRTQEYKAEKLALEAKFASDPRIKHEKVGLVMRMTALRELMQDEKYGTSVTVTVWSVKAAIIILDLLFIFTLMNDHAALYVLRLIGQTRLEAEQYDADVSRSMLQIRESLPISPTRQADRPTSFGELTGETSFALHGGTHTEPDIASSGDRPLFQPPKFSGPASQMQVCVPIPDGAANLGGDGSDHAVIGSAYPIRVTIVQALADPQQYWVNPDRPDEIWDRSYRDDVLSPISGNSERSRVILEEQY